MQLDSKENQKPQSEISDFTLPSMTRVLEDEAFQTVEKNLLQEILDPKKGLKFSQILSAYERRWVENHLREELELHGLLFIWKYGHRSYSEMPREKQDSFRSEMRSFLRGLVSDQHKKKRSCR
jgi:hypothetical protein